jgi:hypothetical protein
MVRSNQAIMIGLMKLYFQRIMLHASLGVSWMHVINGLPSVNDF